jgi:hypothetical protein
MRMVTDAQVRMLMRLLKTERTLAAARSAPHPPLAVFVLTQQVYFPFPQKLGNARIDHPQVQQQRQNSGTAA